MDLGAGVTSPNLNDSNQKIKGISPKKGPWFVLHGPKVLARQFHSGVISFDFDMCHFVSKYPLQGHIWRFIAFSADVQLCEVP